MTPADDALVSTFGRLLEAAHGLERTLGRSLEQTRELPLTWFEVLLRLSRSPEGKLTMGELARQIALTSGGVTRLVDRIAEVGYVERRPCKGDRRIQYAAITDAGRAALAPALEEHAVALRDVFTGFSAAELTALDAALDRLRALPA
jgi:MarR family 2-MHQ and catechol resistance regulon transcriptional repressor